MDALELDTKDTCPAKYLPCTFCDLRVSITPPRLQRQSTPALFKVLRMLSVYPLAILVIIMLGSRAEAATSADCIQQGGYLPCVGMTFTPWSYHTNYGGLGSESDTIDYSIAKFSQQLSSAGSWLCPGTFSYTSTQWAAPPADNCHGFKVRSYINGAESQNSKYFPVSYSTPLSNGSCPGTTVNTTWCIQRNRDVVCPEGYTMTGWRFGQGAASYTPSTEYCAPTNFVSYNTLSLQTPLADVEPSGTATAYANTSRTAYAQVVNPQTNQPKAGVQVKFSVDVLANSGGHDGNHYQMRPKGKLLDCSSGSEVETTVCTTQQDGRATVTFNAPIVSGTHTITATCVSPACTSPASGNINVKVPGLEQIPSESTIYALIGGETDKPHHDNHFLTNNAFNQLIVLAINYHHLYPKDPVLHLNDASLVWGGKFDIKGNWVGEHKAHKRGSVIDIRANTASGNIPERLFTDFKELAAMTKTKLAGRVTSAKAEVHCSRGRDYSVDKCIGDDNRHFHVILLGVDQ